MRTESDVARLDWLDRLKALALAWIFLNHLVEKAFGYPYFANPTADWPPLGERLAQLRPLEGYGFWTPVVDLARYVGWCGDQGVQLFLIASGFGLTYALLGRHGRGPLPLREFYLRRLARIYPLWILAHLGAALGFALTGIGSGFSLRTLLLSLIGVRFTAGTFYAITPAWWFIGLLLQLYLIYPALWAVLRRHGPRVLLVSGCLIAFAARAAGSLLLDDSLDPWLRGAVFVTRLPELVFGMALAAWWRREPERTARLLRRPAGLGAAVASYALGTVLSFTLLGMSVAPFLLGVGAFGVLYSAITTVTAGAATKPGVALWIGRHSFSLYLVHQPVIQLLLPRDSGDVTVRTLGMAVVAAALTVAFAYLLERVWAVLVSAWRWGRRASVVRVVLTCAAVGTASLGLLLGAEAYVRSADPQEALGWGERPALEPHADFGWRLRPSRETRLRWESYDYRVTANELGFPGPLYPQTKAPGTSRILTTGDAFTSAEGVDTAQAWPRRLEALLADRLPNGRAEVLNFAVTGYGPNQYAAVIEPFAARYRPDLILIGFFVNDYEDVQHSDPWFRRSIGFGRPSGEAAVAWLTAAHLRRWLALRAVRWRSERLKGVAWGHGYFLGNFAALERGSSERWAQRRALVTERLRQIREVAESIAAPVVLAMVPAPVQVCSPNALTYYPAHVDLHQETRFDLEQPQRLTQSIAEELGFGFYDLREVLQSTPSCPYQSGNMHWTPAGHELVASFLAERLVADRHIATPNDGLLPRGSRAPEIDR